MDTVLPDNVEVVIEDEFKDTDVIYPTVFDGKKDVTLKDLLYICRYNKKFENCHDCILRYGKVCGFSLLLKLVDGDFSSLNNSLLAWLEENPPTSFLLDVKFKMPGINMNKDYNIPNMCVKQLYSNFDIKCEKSNCEFSVESETCRRCWRKPMEDLINDVAIND